MTTTKPLVSQRGMSTLQRPRFGAGLLLEADDLTAGVDYTRNLMRLMFRSLFGCGVICGLKVTAELVCNRSKVSVTVQKGLALDCMGDPIYVPVPTTLVYDPDCKEIPPRLWVVACYVEKCCRPKDVSCSPDEDGQILHTRSHDGFEIRLYAEEPACACACGAKADESAAAPAAANGSGATDTTTTDATAGAVASAGDATPRPAGCECYDDHNAGICDCDCGCDCVYLATVDTRRALLQKTIDPKTYGPVESSKDSEPSLQIAAENVRRIRPVLTGFLQCLQALPIETPTNGGTGGDAGPGTDGGTGGNG